MYNENSFGNSGYGIGDISVLDLVNLTCRINPIFATIYKNLSCKISVVYAQNLKNLNCSINVIYTFNYINLNCKTKVLIENESTNGNLRCTIKHHHHNWSGWHINISKIDITELIEQNIVIEELIPQTVCIK